jgi:hypothetical protein
MISSMAARASVGSAFKPLARVRQMRSQAAIVVIRKSCLNPWAKRWMALSSRSQEAAENPSSDLEIRTRTNAGRDNREVLVLVLVRVLLVADGRWHYHRGSSGGHCCRDGMLLDRSGTKSSRAVPTMSPSSANGSHMFSAVGAIGRSQLGTCQRSGRCCLTLFNTTQLRGSDVQLDGMRFGLRRHEAGPVHWCALQLEEGAGFRTSLTMATPSESAETLRTCGRRAGCQPPNAAPKPCRLQTRLRWRVDQSRLLPLA